MSDIVSIDINKSLFILYLALNRYGYDSRDMADFHPVRQTVRDELFKTARREEKIALYFGRAERRDISEKHPFWPFVCFLVNTLFLLEYDDKRRVFSRVPEDRLREHFAPYLNDFPIRIGHEEIEYMAGLPDMLNLFVESAPVHSLWELYRDFFLLPGDFEERFLRDMEWFEAHLSLPEGNSFSYIPNFMEREWYGSVVTLPRKILILSGPVESYPARIIRHEMLHIGLDPLVASLDGIERFYERIQPSREILEKNGYWGFDVRSSSLKVLTDTIARAITCYLNRRDGMDIAEEVAWNNENGFSLAGEALSLIAPYLEKKKRISKADLQRIFDRLVKNQAELFNVEFAEDAE